MYRFVGLFTYLNFSQHCYNIKNSFKDVLEASGVLVLSFRYATYVDQESLTSLSRFIKGLESTGAKVLITGESKLRVGNIDDVDELDEELKKRRLSLVL